MGNLNNQKILYIWDADYPWDVRVEKICNSLKNQGYEVHIAARNLKKRPATEEIEGIYIHRLKALANDKLNYITSFPLFFSPVWKRFLEGIIVNHNIALIIVRDLPMAVAGIWAGKRHNIPVIFDMAEDYVAMLKDIWQARKFRGLNLLIRNPYSAKRIERYVFRNVDHILVVVDEAKGLAIREGCAPDRVTIVSNTPELDTFDTGSIDMTEDLYTVRKRFSAIYTGGVQMGRGIQTVFEAIPEITKIIPEFLFVVVGNGYATQILKEMIESQRIGDHVLWVGWVDHQNIYSYIKACKVGIIPHFRSEHTNTTIPNKIFDYMGCGLPVVATNTLPLKRILEEECCGIVFESDNSKHLAKAIIEIYHANDQVGNNGKEAVNARYNWAIDSNRLMEVINRFT